MAAEKVIHTPTLNEIIDLFWEQAFHWLITSFKFLPNIIVAVLIFIVFRYVNRYVKKIVRKVLEKNTNNQALINLTVDVSGVATILAGLFLTLVILHLDRGVVSMLAGAGLIGLALGFAFQDLATNFISGVIITFQQPIRVGDMIETNGFIGTVKDIKLRSILIDNFAGQNIEIPSKDVFQKPIINYSITKERRMSVTCGVHYSTDLAFAQQIAIDAVKELPFLLPEKNVDVHFQTFADSSINFIVFFWVNPLETPGFYAISEAIKAIKIAFDKNNITIPFPIRTLEFRQEKLALEK
jgi:small conductance mechanosensitive channel